MGKKGGRGFTHCLLAPKEEGYRSQSNIAFMMSPSRVLVVSPHRNLCGKMTNEQRSPPNAMGLSKPSEFHMNQEEVDNRSHAILLISPVRQEF